VPHDPHTRALTLDELIDLELQLQRDRGLPLETLDARDAPIAARIAAGEAGASGDRAAIRSWLNAVRPPRDSPGRRIVELRDLCAVLLFGAGLLMGASGIGAWLLQGTGTPVNVVYFWPAVIGSQLALLGLWAIAALPNGALRWIPGLRPAQSLLRGLGGLLPWLVSRAAARGIGAGREIQQTLSGELRRLDWLYGRLRFWVVTALTQSFAVGFNLGALAAFVVIPYLDDPAFGWRSRLLGPDEVHRAAQTLALPWRGLGGLVEGAAPDLGQVRATRYSSIDPRLAERSRTPPAGEPGSAVARDPGERSADPGARGRGAPAPEPASRALRPDRSDVWAVWWPFLVASLCVYGLVPRLLLWTTAKLALRRELRRAPREHAEYRRLLERLRRHAVDTRALGAEHEAAPSHPVQLPAPDRSLPSGAVRVLRWAGVPIAEEQIRLRLNEAGAEVEGAVTRVGGLDAEADADTLAEIEAAKADTPVCLLVEAWEPPVADYTDLVRDLRAGLGAETPLWILLVAQAGASPEELALQQRQWQRQLAALGDPWLHVTRWTSP